jgi:AraC-like DNA-binding protein
MIESACSETSRSAPPFSIEVFGAPLQSQSGLYGAGEARCSSSRDRRLIECCYAHASIGVVVDGEFDYRSSAGNVIAGHGAILLGNAGEAFTYRYRDDRDVRRSVIAIDNAILEQVAAACGLDRVTFQAGAILASRQSLALYGAVRRFAGAQTVQGHELLDLVGAALQLGSDRRKPSGTRAERRRVLDVARHLDTAFSETITLSEMAKLAAMSQYHFIRVFRQVMGETPHKYLVGARLRAAADGLADTHEPITSLALRVGFNDISNFNATFRTEFGMSPRSWRMAA